MNLLNEREKTHGSFDEVARVAQRLKDEVWSASIPNVHQEALDMICTKIARIVCGDHNEKDHWIDIMGYAKLVLKTLEVPSGSAAKEPPDGKIKICCRDAVCKGHTTVIVDEPQDPSVGDNWDYRPRGILR